MIAPPKAFRTSINSVRPMVDLRTEIAGVRLRNPTMLASGFLDETGGSMARVYEAGAGAVVTKSIGPKPREGYPNPTIVELDAGLLNAVGLPNPGVIEYEHEVKKAHAAGAVVIGSVFGKDAEEYAAVAAKMSKYGGLSGPAIRSIGVRAVYDICEKVHVPVIGVGGVGSGRDALEYIMAGASAVQIGTAILSRGLGVFDEVVQEMGVLLEEAGFNSVPEAIGVAHA